MFGPLQRVDEHLKSNHPENVLHLAAMMHRCTPGHRDITLNLAQPLHDTHTQSLYITVQHKRRVFIVYLVIEQLLCDNFPVVKSCPGVLQNAMQCFLL